MNSAIVFLLAEVNHVISSKGVISVSACTCAAAKEKWETSKLDIECGCFLFDKTQLEVTKFCQCLISVNIETRRCASMYGSKMFVVFPSRVA